MHVILKRQIDCMRNSLIDLRDKLPEGLVEVYQAVQSAASELQLAVLARDLV